MPYAGTHRLIDFPLSNCHNAGLSDVWISQQFNPISLSDHLANGRPWDLDRTIGGLLILQPRLDHGDRGGFQKGTADALWRNAPLIREHGPEALVVVSADAVYAQDYGALVEEHMDGRRGGHDGHHRGRARRRRPLRRRAGATAARSSTTPTSPTTRPATWWPTRSSCSGRSRCSTRSSSSRTRRARTSSRTSATGSCRGSSTAGGARESRFDGYWRDVGTVDAYWESHMDLLGEEPPIDLDDPDWPILTHEALLRASARVFDGAAIEDSLVAPAARVAGSVSRSVVGRGAVVEEGAVVRESVLLPGAVVRVGRARGARGARRRASRSGATSPWGRTAARSRSSDCGRP